MNLPEAKSAQWGQGLTKAKMGECQWLKPMLAGQFEFLEWTGDNHLGIQSSLGCGKISKPRTSRGDERGIRFAARSREDAPNTHIIREREQ